MAASLKAMDRSYPGIRKLERLLEKVGALDIELTQKKCTI